MHLHRLLPSIRIQAGRLVIGLALVALLSACSAGTPSPGVEVEEPGLPTPTQGQAPEAIQTPPETPPPIETQAPAESEAPSQPDENVPTEAPSTGSAIDACELVTKEEVEAVLGSPVGEPVEEVVPPIYGCSYKTEELDGVSLVLVEYDDASQAEASFQMAIDINNYAEVSGIGERAYLAYPIFDINVLVGRYELSVDVFDSSEKEEQYEKARDLAEKALGRLP